MEFFLELYRITLDFIYKISGPVIAIAVIGLIILYRKGLGEFISKNIAKIKGKVAGQEFEIDLQKEAEKIKESQSEAVKVTLPKKLVEESNPEIERLKKELEFEKIYSIIFGSQIQYLNLLKKENSVVGTRLYLIIFLSEMRKQHSIYASWNLEDFLNILKKNSLIDEKNQDYSITQKGLDFLQYIEENNYNDRLF